MCKLYILMLFYALVPNQFYSLVKCELQSIEWCELDCVAPKGNIKNTMCEHVARKSTFGCHAIRDVSSPETVKEILHRHNAYRSVVAGGKKGWPPAANMRQMTWDMALEVLALRWAEQCIAGNDKCRRTPDFYTVGQNYCVLANWKYYVVGVQDCFKGWTDGIHSATSKILDSFEGGDWAHFTQIVWAKSYKLGCAQVGFRQSSRGVAWKKTALVCNYGPGGNLIGEKIYEIGDPCSQCPTNTSCRRESSYPHLCALPEDPIGAQDIIEDNEYIKRHTLHKPAKNGAGITVTMTYGDPLSLKSGQLKCDKKGAVNYPLIRSQVPVLMTMMHLTLGWPLRSLLFT